MLSVKRLNRLDPSSLGRTATVVGQRRDVDDLGNGNASAMDSANSRFTAIARTLDIGFHLAQAEVVSDLSAVFGSHLSGVGGVLLRTTETHLASRGPRDYLSLTIGEAHNDVVE